MTLQEASELIGRKVVYQPFKNCDNNCLEYGVITSVNDTYVFVRYGNDVNSKSTRPEDLKLDCWR